MAFVLLGVAIVFEVLATSLLKSTDGFSRPWPTVSCLAAYAVAFLALALAIQRGLQVGVGYAIWSGLGTTLIVIIGALMLREPVTPATLAGIALVVSGVVVLNLSGAH
ncbi:MULTISPECIES: DMT family transporter [Actinokineospora]|uniref:Multidrug resistance protein mmr n=1 Tax=Actinokineospora fastidiosa TaxID=1816 RepID=A0A918GTG9_9PSEU|nr:MULTISPECIES: multidrug efflux SMR transporter [Actinokineospora]UVS81559.1 Multidrug resistance protein EbrB [Actinokineospora sp. UTMC 2448]GGS57188.1 multidrug resistance protein mmr [Actinokineospora fastidiosa]